jgi:hypothetical protein
MFVKSGPTLLVVLIAAPASLFAGPGAAALVTSKTSAGPSGGVTIVDDTNLLTVTVPVDWSDQDTQSGRRDDGSARPQITAAPNIEQFYESFNSSGLYLTAMPATTDPAVVLAQHDYTGVCSDGGIVPYDDGRFTGQQQTWTSCDGGEARAVHVAARPPDNSFMMFLQVGQAAPDDAQLLRIIASLGTVAGAVYPAPSAPVPLVPTGAVPPGLLTAPVTPTTTVVDDTGRLSISVPATWTDIDGSSDINDNGSVRPVMAAAPNLNDFFSDWLVPGTQITAFPFNSDPSALLRNLGFADQCGDGGVQSFDNGTYIGLMQTWTDCGGLATRNVQLAVSPADRSATVHIEVQLPDADNAPLQAVLSSLPASSPTVPTSTVTTTTTVTTSSVVVAPRSTMPANPDNDHVFTFGDVEIPPGRPGQLSVVLAKSLDTSEVVGDTSDLIVVVRNDRDEAVYTILVTITGTDESGAETFSTIVMIETAGLEPGEWTFGRKDLVPRLDQTTHFDVFFHDLGQPGDFAELEVTGAVLRDDVIVGTVMNNANGPLVDSIAVNVICFHESEITAYPLATADAQELRAGESSTFTTTRPIDSTTCTAFAIYAVGAGSANEPNDVAPSGS